MWEHRRIVDSFFINIWICQLIIGRQKLLNRENRKHRIVIQMLFHNHFSEVRLQLLRRSSLLSQLLIIILLGEISILVPPLSKRRTIVRTCRYHVHISCIFRIVPRDIVRWHSLNFQCSNRELIHHHRHRIGHQT